ncbi:MAG: MFS transporter [Thermodesulfobacteriota bacterium]
MKQKPWLVFSMVAVGVFLSTMDSSMINVALPSIMRSFGTTLPRTEWVVLIYLLTITVSLLFWGRIGDLLGKGTVYLSGMLVFGVGSLACYGAGTLGQLICFRFFQALGASMMMAMGPAIIKMVFPLKQLGMALGLIGVATSIGLMSGPVISGMLIENYSWRAIFLVTVPVSVGLFLPGWYSLRPLLSGPGRKRINHPFDWPGMLLWSTVLTLIVLLSTHHRPVSPLLPLSEIILLFLFLFLFIKAETANPAPLFPVELFRRQRFFIGIVCAALSFAVLFVVLILIPFYLDYILNLSPGVIGLVMMAVPISVFLVSPLAGFLYNRIGARLLTTGGLTIASLAMFLLSFLSPETTPLGVAWRLAVLGAGQALFLSPNSTAILEQVGHDQAGVSSGMLATARNLGMLLGVSLAGLLFGLIFSQLSGGLDLKHYEPEQLPSFILALRITFGLTAVLSVVGAVLSGMRKGKREVSSKDV